jgi:hypothetical protein
MNAMDNLPPDIRLDFQTDRVTIAGLTAAGKRRAEREAEWYRQMCGCGFPYIPHIYSYGPLAISRVEGQPVYRANLNPDGKRRVLERVMSGLYLMHSYGRRSADQTSLMEEYYRKILRQLDLVKANIPFANKPYISINGSNCHNVLFFRNEFRQLVKDHLYTQEFQPIHGDVTFTNILLDDTGHIYFINARGYFGHSAVYGDVYYDWAKLYASINGNFDQFNLKNFTLEIEPDRVRFKIASNGWEFLTHYLLGCIHKCSIGRIQLIHAILWLSLAGNSLESTDSFCVAFYYGLLLLERFW